MDGRHVIYMKKLSVICIFALLMYAFYPTMLFASSEPILPAENPSAFSASASIRSLAGGGFHSIALAQDGTVWTAGDNGFGQLGDGTTSNRTVFGPVPGIHAVAIAGGWKHTVALKSDGTVWAWGNNEIGQLGDGTLTNRSTPVQVTGLSGITAVVSRTNHSIALKDDGTVFAWGQNTNGQLGDGTTIYRTKPVQVPGLSDVTAVAAGFTFTIALKRDGTVWTWGHQIHGDGSTRNELSPIQVPGLGEITAIAGGENHAIALKSDGSVWTWGANGYGYIGDGTTTNRPAPVQVAGGVKAIAGGGLHTIVLKNDGAVWTWGNNQLGQLGDGTTADRWTQIQAGISDVVAIAGGELHTLALKNDGTVWSWGDNRSGQLGDGTPTNRFNPVLVQWLIDPEPSLTKITLDSTSYTLIKGNTHQTIVTAHFSDNSSRTVTDEADFQSSIPAAASVNVSGLVTGVNAGQSNITVSYLGKTATVSVTVSEPSTEGFLYGVIIDTTTNAPAPGLTLTFRKGIDVTDGPIAATITSTYGEYDVTLPYGDYTAVITGDNYEPSTLVATVNSPTNSKNGTITRKPETMSGYLYGVIIDTTTNAPAPGLTLTFRKGIDVTDGPVAATITSAYGDYDVTLPYGDYTAVITGDNYEPSTLVATVNSPTSSKNGTITRKSETMSGYLYGVIIDTTTNVPAPGLTLTFRKGIDVTDGPIAATITSTYGDYDVTLPYGDYTAVITGANYEPSTLVATVNSPTSSKNGTITRKRENPPNPPVIIMPPGPTALLPDDWLTGKQPYLSLNPAVLTELNNGQTTFRLNTGTALSLIRNSSAESPICTFGADVSGTATFEIPASVAAAAVEKGQCSGSLLVLTHVGSYSLPLSVLKANGGLEDGAVTRITIAPAGQSERTRINAASTTNQVTLLPIPAINFSLSIIKGGETKAVEDFGDVFVQRTMHLGKAAENAASLGLFLFDEPSGALLFTPARFVADEKGDQHAIFQRTTNSTYAAGYKLAGFQDIAAHWAQSAINKLAGKGLVAGKADGRFAPDEPVTRAEFAALLVRALGLQNKEGSGSFRDVLANDPYRHEMLIALQLGFAIGHTGAFRPNETITREEMAVMITRALKYVQPGWATAAADLAMFKDSEQVSVWALTAVRIAVANGILVGNSKRALNPAAPGTRAQAVLMVERLLRKLTMID